MFLKSKKAMEKFTKNVQLNINSERDMMNKKQNSFDVKSLMDKRYIEGKEHIKKGDFLEKSGNFSDARSHFECALVYLSEVYDKTRNEEVLHEITMLFNQIAHSYALVSNAEEALVFYNKSLSLRKDIYKNTPSPENILDISFCFDRIGRMHEKRMDFKEAIKCYQSSLYYAKKVDGQLDKVECEHIYASLCNRKAYAFFRMNEYDKALENYIKSFSICREKFSNSASVGNAHDLFVCTFNIAEFMQFFGDIEDAFIWFNYGCDILKHIDENDNLKDYAYCCLTLAQAYAERGETKSAIDCSIKSVELHKRIFQNDSHIKNKLHYAAALGCAGNIYFTFNDYENAEIWYNKSLEFNLELLNNAENPETLRNLSISCDRIGDLKKAIGDTEGAEEYYLKAVEYDEIINKRYPSYEAINDLAYSYEKLCLNGKNTHYGDLAKSLIAFQNNEYNQ